ncbi:citrate synthase [Fusarium tjaetaba]|uniref:Citrate synthase n=1 Tax=Fusarium tjaetaba TaxID=1567544 RepID=A0A8H5V5S9_9HYPO|nr:citrate synthase [Fusarium tjaetaba]KAF5609830.1 citrate synthase [Fusarium tjaetaba]
MASVARLSNAALRASLRSSPINGSVFNAVRCYSAKTQTLKERFAELLPEKIEQVKALRKSVAFSSLGSLLVELGPTPSLKLAIDGRTTGS